MDELQNLRKDLCDLQKTLIDAIAEYSTHIEEQKKQIETLVSNAEKMELYDQIDGAVKRANQTIEKKKTPQYY